MSLTRQQSEYSFKCTVHGLADAQYCLTLLQATSQLHVLKLCGVVLH
jgi:hypothetical protein